MPPPLAAGEATNQTRMFVLERLTTVTPSTSQPPRLRPSTEPQCVPSFVSLTEAPAMMCTLSGELTS